MNLYQVNLPMAVFYNKLSISHIFQLLSDNTGPLKNTLILTAKTLLYYPAAFCPQQFSYVFC